MRKIVLIASILLLFSTSVVMTLVSQVVAQGTIYIRSDGRVDPSTAPIRRDGNVYTFTDNIYDEIVVEKDNIVVDGASHILQGTGSGTGIYLSGRSNVAIQNMQIRYFDTGIYLRGSSSNNIYGNAITNNGDGIYLRGSSSNNIYGNAITNNGDGIYLRGSSSNNIYGNAITNNGDGVYFDRSSENVFYHNSFIDNAEQVYVTRENVWDDGYPSGGNYWSDYTGVDQYSGPNQDEVGSDGIGDTEYFIDSMNRDRYPLMSDLVPPLISIISPENKTYAVTAVPLVFTVSEPTPWMGYSLDDQVNVTVGDNTTLVGLSDGVHTITVYANDTAGNTGSSQTVYFTVDTVRPNIKILSPENLAYAAADVPLSFTVNEPTSWMGYSLDSLMNVTVGDNTTLVGLSDGVHTITVYANDTAGNTGHSETVYFTVDTVASKIGLLSPENKTYTVTTVPLTFTVSEATSWIRYSLDGQANNTIAGNTTLMGLSDGSHWLVVYASDMAGNMGSSETVYFTIDTVAPKIELLSPENKMYTTNSVSLSFTVNEPTSLIVYSLDGQKNVTINGNTTLVDLSDGVHTIIVYAADAAGNVGYSETVYFTIDTTLPSITILSPENKTYDTNFVPLSFTVDEQVSWMAYSLDGQANVTITENVTLPLPDGLHYVVVYANDTAGNMGASSTVYFSVDSVVPSILLVSPINTTYASTSVPLRFVTYEIASWMGYSLDGLMNVTVGDNTTLVGLSDGVHTITVYANDTAGNTGSSQTVYFTIDTMVSNIEILSPGNKTYAAADVPLVFTVSEATSWIGYSLDGQANSTIAGNATLIGLSDGMHSLMVYASDMVGNMGSSETVYFAVDTTLPSITILSPENKTYADNDVPLSLTVDEQVSWMAYSLDGQANVTITGDITLSGLSKGSHSLTVYVKDMAGNAGASKVVHFAVEIQQPEPSELFIVAVIAILAGAGFALTGYMAYDLFGRPRNELRPRTKGTFCSSLFPQ